MVSIRLEAITSSAELLGRSAQVLAVFLTVLLLAAAVTMPQSATALGAEQTAIAIGCAVVLGQLDAVARREQRTRPSSALVLVTLAFVCAAAAAGVLVACGITWGMYLYGAATTIGLVWGVVGAWAFLARAGAA